MVYIAITFNFNLIPPLHLETRSKTKSKEKLSPQRKRKRDLKEDYKLKSQVDAKNEVMDNDKSMDLNSEDIPNDFEFNNDESAINAGNLSIKKENFSFEKLESDNARTCLMCHTGKKKPIELTCKHKIHKGCLLTKIQQGMVNNNFKFK